MKRFLSNLLSASVFLGAASSVFPAHIVAHATTNNSLSPGKYVTTLYRGASYTETPTAYNSAQKFCSQAILEVKEDGTQYITVGIQNWSFYDAFITLNQEYTDEYISTYSKNIAYYVPERLLDERELTDEDTFREKISANIINTTDENRDWFNYSADSNGCVDFDEQQDIGYVTVEVDDYTKPVYCIGWYNVPTSSYSDKLAGKLANYSLKYHGGYLMWIDTNSITSVEEIYNSISSNDVQFTVRQATQDNSLNHSNVSYTGNSTVLSLFNFENFEVIDNSNGTFTAKFYLNYYDEYSENHLKANCFKYISGKSYSESKTYLDWQYYPGNETGPTKSDNCNTFESIDICDDENGNYILLNFTEKELLFGKYLWFNSYNESSSKDESFFCCPCISLDEPVRFFDIEATSASGIKFSLSTNSTMFPYGTELVIDENNPDYDYGYTSGMYKSCEWFHISFKNGNDVVTPKGHPVISFQYPATYANPYVEVRDPKGVRVDTGYSIVVDYDNNMVVDKDTGCNNSTYAIGILNDMVELSTLENGVYSVNIYFNKDKSTALNGTPSMANAALVHDAYVVKDNDDYTLYFKACEMSANGVDGLYIGGLENPESSKDTIYTDFLTEKTVVNGKETTIISNNVGYDGITEFACVKGGIIKIPSTLWSSEHRCYALLVSSPVMAEMAKMSYEDALDAALPVRLVFTNANQVTSDTSLKSIEDNIIANGYGYQPSALLRKTKQAEISYNIGENTVNTSTAFANAKAVLAETNPTSQEIEEAIKALDELTTDTIPTATATVKGYSLTAKEDFGLHLYLDLGYDAQNDDGASVVFTIDGVEQKPQPVVIDKDDPDSRFVPGCGYEFTLDVPAKAMYDEITAKIVLSDGQEVIGDANLGTYSVAGYLNDYLKNDSNTELNALAKATLNYGAYAEKYFKSKADNISDSAVSKVTADNVKDFASEDMTLEAEGIEFAGASLTLKDKTSINLYFNVTDKFAIVDKDYEFRLFTDPSKPEGTVVKATRYASGSSYYCVTIPDISANNLNEKYYFTVNGQKLWYSPYTYVHTALTKTSAEENADLHNLVKALYLYGEEAGKVS